MHWDDPPASLTARWSEEALADGVVEYATELAVGRGEYDRIGLHRVVAGVPGERAVFLVHGSFETFDDAFAGGEHALAVFLARAGYDVWGIDLRGTSVPAEETDFGFMADWDLGTHVADVRSAMGIARLERTASGAGMGPIPLLGFSRGAVVAYAVAGREADLPVARRQASAIVALDVSLVYDDPEHQERACETYDARVEAWTQGQFQNSVTPLGRLLIGLAFADPDGPSPIVPGLTNEQVFLVVYAAPWLCEGCYAPDWWHSSAGASWVSVPPGLWLPFSLAFTDPGFLITKAVQRVPHEDLGTWVDMAAMGCSEVSGWEDTFEDVTVPVLYVGARGGEGADGYPTADAFVAADVTRMLVDPPSGEPCPLPDPRACAFGHLDTIYASNAPDLVWTPVLEWLDAHGSRP